MPALRYAAGLLALAALAVRADLLAHFAFLCALKDPLPPLLRVVDLRLADSPYLRI